MDWRTSASTSVNDSIANAGASPVASCSSARKPSSVSGLHAAVRVVDEHDLARAEAALGDRERADHVVGDHPAGVAQDVRLAVAQPERGERVQARVHARHDGQAPARPDVEVHASGSAAAKARLLATSSSIVSTAAP